MNSTLLSAPQTESADFQSSITLKKPENYKIASYEIPSDRKERMRILANVIIDKFLEDLANGRLKKFD